MPRIIQLVLHFFGLADHPEPWEGPTGDYFISDKDTTYAYLSSCGKFRPNEVDILRKVLGVTIVANIAGRRFMIANDYVEEGTGLQIVRRGRNQVLARHRSAVYQRSLVARILRAPNDQGYWVISNDPIPGYREYFRPLTEDEFLRLTSELKRNERGFPLPTPPSKEIVEMAQRASRQLR